MNYNIKRTDYINQVAALRNQFGFIILLAWILLNPSAVFSTEDSTTETGKQNISPSSPTSVDSVSAIKDIPQKNGRSLSVENMADNPELMLFQELPFEIDITSVSKKLQKLSEAPAAIYVITSEDIRRSGVTSIPEALRMAPGLEVARVNSSQWAITSRGFNASFGNMLLVLIDGRSVYTPAYSGVYWDVQDVMLEDIDRIEVIRGPGGTLWGANAVNGVINIITKKAQDTQGVLFSSGAGTEDRGITSLRYGGKLGEKTYYRAYGKYFDRDMGIDTATGHEGSDDWAMKRFGFRIDSEPSSEDTYTLQGDGYDGYEGQRLVMSQLSMPYFDDIIKDNKLSGGNVLGRWRRTFDAFSDITVQMYYDRTNRATPIYRENRDTLDIDFQHHFYMGEVHDVIWGAGYRFTTDTSTTYGSPLTISPKCKDGHIVSSFVQDEIRLVPDRLKLIVGSKFEYNNYTQFEVQPTMRLVWTPDKNNTFWGAVSRAVQTPGRSYVTDINFDLAAIPDVGAGIPGMTRIVGNDELESQELLAFEGGYRTRLSDHLFVDATGFFNRYDNLFSNELQTTFFEMDPLPPHLVIPYRFDNRFYGETYGTEVSADWQATDALKLAGGFSFFQMQLHKESSSTDPGFHEIQEGKSPHFQAHLRSYVNLPWNLEWDTMIYYVDSLPAIDIGSYVRVDVRLGWKVNENLSFSVVGQNLFDRRHPEFAASDEGNQPTESERAFYAQLQWRF